jgi:hypothetical protein
VVAVTLIGKSNGVGLARDLALLADTLQQCGVQVQVYAAQRSDGRQRRSLLVQTLARTGAWWWRRHRRGRRVSQALRVNVMLEHVWPQFLHTADMNIAVPNPEWFDRRDQRLLAALDGVWTKTRHAEQVFQGLGCRTAFIGFDSEDRYDPLVPRECSFFHLAGKSRMKGTDRLIALWLRHPEWPELVLITHGKEAVPVPEAPNIRTHRDYLEDAELRRLQNASRFHLCLSEAEGWGHYIVEALSIGAVTITLDAAPMNELVQPDRGLLVAGMQGVRQNLSDTVRFDEAALERTIGAVLALEPPRVAALGQAARRWYLDNRRDFPTRVGQALSRLDTFAAH